MIVNCPECHKDIDTDKENAAAHGSFHWGVAPKDVYTLENPEAMRRYQVLIDAAKKAEALKEKEAV